jgi:hypothetical protein
MLQVFDIARRLAHQRREQDLALKLHELLGKQYQVELVILNLGDERIGILRQHHRGYVGSLQKSAFP